MPVPADVPGDRGATVGPYSRIRWFVKCGPLTVFASGTARQPWKALTIVILVTGKSRVTRTFPRWTFAYRRFRAIVAHPSRYRTPVRA